MLFIVLYTAVILSVDLHDRAGAIVSRSTRADGSVEVQFVTRSHKRMCAVRFLIPIGQYYYLMLNWVKIVSHVNNYIVRSYRDLIIVNNTATRRTNKA